MADLNALIAQGVQFQKPVNPFVQYGQMQQLQQNEQANQLNQMKMQEMQRGMEETNAMRRLDPNSESYLADITRISPEKGFAFGKMRQEAKTAATEGQIKDTKLLADKLALLPDAYRMADTPEAYLALHQSVHADPVLGPYLKSLGATPEKGMATLQNAVQTGKFNELRMGSMQSVSQLLDSMKTQPDAALMQQLGYPQTPAGYEAFRQAQRTEPRERLLTPEELKQKLQIAAASRAPGTTVNMVSERAEQGARGKMLVDDFSTITKSAQLAVKTIPSIEANLNILNKGFDTGFGTETIAAGANVLAALGVKDANKYATDAQMFKSKATEAVLQKQLEQKGPQTESDAQRIDAVGAQLGKTKDANQFVLTVAKEQLKRDIDQRNFYANWYKNNKTYDGAEDAWYTGKGGDSLFTSPALKKYTAPTPANAAPVASNRPSLESIFKK